MSIRYNHKSLGTCVYSGHRNVVQTRLRKVNLQFGMTMLHCYVALFGSGCLGTKFIKHTLRAKKVRLRKDTLLPRQTVTARYVINPTHVVFSNGRDSHGLKRYLEGHRPQIPM